MAKMKTQEQFEKEIHEKYNGKISVVGKYIGFYKESCDFGCKTLLCGKYPQNEIFIGEI